VAKVDGKTVATVRAEQEGRAEIPHVETRTDTKGRKQPAKRAKTVKTQPGMDPNRDVINTTFDLVARMDAGQRTEFFALLREKYGAELRDLIGTENPISTEAAQPQKRRGRPRAPRTNPSRRQRSRPWTRSRRPWSRTPPPPDVGADNMRAQIAALDDGSDPGPMPESLRRVS
jgi:hypothetical protein